MEQDNINLGIPELFPSDPLGQAMEVLNETSKKLYEQAINFTREPGSDTGDEMNAAFNAHSEAIGDVLTEILDDTSTDMEKAIKIATIFIGLDAERKDFFQTYSEGYEFKKIVEPDSPGASVMRDSYIRRLRKEIAKYEETDEVSFVLGSRYFEEVTHDVNRLRSIVESNEECSEVEEEMTETPITPETPVIALGNIAVSANMSLSLVKGFKFSLRITRQGES